MKKFFLTILLIILAISSYSAINKILYQRSQTINLTEDEMVEDFLYLYDTLEENYPLFELLKRKYNYDWLANKDAYIEAISDCHNDNDFYVELKTILEDLMHLGSVKIITPVMYQHYCESMAEDPFFLVYQEKLWSKEVSDHYRKWHKIIEPKFNQRTSEANQNDQLETAILEKDKIAYMKISSFLGNKPLCVTKTQAHEDKVDIQNFYNTVVDYDHLIIDIRDNSAGYDYYWQYYIVAPIIKSKLDLPSFSVYKTSPLINEYHPFFNYATNNMAKMPIWLNTPKEIKTDYFRWDHSIAEVFPTSHIDFNGKIYLLVNENVSGSASLFTQFAKANKWATIVGKETKGISYKSGYFFFHLPNSKLIIRCNDSVTLNYKGHIAEERGTLPDVLIEDDDDGLEKILDLIKKDH